MGCEGGGGELLGEDREAGADMGCLWVGLEGHDRQGVDGEHVTMRGALGRVGPVVPDPAEVIDGLLEAGPVPRHAQRQRGGVARDVPGHPVPEARSGRGVGIEAGHREGAGALRGAGPAQVGREVLPAEIVDELLGGHHRTLGGRGGGEGEGTGVSRVVIHPSSVGTAAGSVEQMPAQASVRHGCRECRTDAWAGVATLTGMPENAPDPGAVDFTPVVVGGDIGAYSLARAFHEAYGIRTVVISRLAGWVVGTSALIDNVRCEDPFDADVLAPVLQQVADARPNGRLLLLGSADATVKAIIRVRDEIGLDERYIAPYISLDTFVAATEKQNFTRLCQQLGVDHPGTVVVDLAEEIPGDLEIPFEFPVIAKPAEVSEWKRIQFPGQNKVHTVASREDLLELLRTIRGRSEEHTSELQ